MLGIQARQQRSLLRTSGSKHDRQSSFHLFYNLPLKRHIKNSKQNTPFTLADKRASFGALWQGTNLLLIVCGKSLQRSSSCSNCSFIAATSSLEAAVNRVSFSCRRSLYTEAWDTTSFCRAWRRVWDRPHSNKTDPGDCLRLALHSCMIHRELLLLGLSWTLGHLYHFF